MKKSTQPGAPLHAKGSHRKAGSEGRWEIKSQSLHALGADGSLQRPMYLTSSGELRFLPL